MNLIKSIIFTFALSSTIASSPDVDAELNPLTRIHKFGNFKHASTVNPIIEHEDTSRVGTHNYSEVNKNQVHRIDINIDWFIARLTSYINQTSFNYNGFNSNITNLRNEISDIEYIIETRLNFEHRTAKHAVLARKVFQRMVETSDKLRRYHGLNARGSSYLCSMLELEIFACLHSLEGYSNRQIGGFMHQKTQLYCRIDKLKQGIWRQTSVPSGVLSLFEVVASRTKNLLEAGMINAGIDISTVQLCPILTILK